jgi:gas vesicle structural protein
MALERTASTSNIMDILDRVLDKGIVIDAWVRVSLVGIELVTVEARVVVASIATYLGYADTLAEIRPTAQASSAAPRELQWPVSSVSANGQPNRKRSRIATV